MVSLVEVIRAKSKRYGRYLLREHIEDTLTRAVQIWNFVQKNREKIEYDFITSEETFKNLAKALFLHDLGKIDYGFQKKVFEPKERDKSNPSEEWKTIKEFFTIEPNKYPSDFKIKDHEILSVIHTVIFLSNGEWDKKIRTAILLHHYNKFFVEREQHITRIIDDYPNVVDYIKFIEKKWDVFNQIYNGLIGELKKEFENVKFIVDALEELKLSKENLSKLKEFINNGFGVSTVLPMYELYNVDFKESIDFFVFLGLLRRCDYSASAGSEVRVETEVSIEELMRDLPDKIKQRIRGTSGKIWQEEIIEKYKEKKDLVLIAPTGSGKTEFALLWAKYNGKKLLYTLPLRVALNDLYMRFAENNGYFENKFVDLLHSTAFIEYLKGEQKSEDISIDAKLKEIEMFASPILLTTPDQVFLSSLRYYGFDKLMAVYPLSSIVIDEIQAYDPEMAAIIIKTLKMIKEVQGNILVITATFPPYFEKFLVNGKLDLNFTKVDLKKEKNEVSQEIKNYDLKRHKIKLIDYRLFERENEENKKQLKVKDIEKLKKIIEDPKHLSHNVLIIVNNVSKAIKLFETLEKEYENQKIWLLHSRLIEKEKSKRINKIKHFLDKKIKGEISPNERIIVVSTQLVEASVDFDFDVLITEISPIDSQIQRWGRVYRNRGKQEGDYKEENPPNVYIFTGIDEDTRTIYHPLKVLEKTIDILGDKEDKVLGYEDERNLIDKVYNDKEIKEKYEKEIEKTIEWLDYYQASKKSEAQKLFRRIAGIQVVIPALMRKDSDETVKSFAEIIEDPESDKLTWKEIEEKVKADKWTLKKMLYEYSVNIPVFYWEHLERLNKHEFKGFYVIKISDEEAENVLKCGIDIIFKKSEEDVLENLL